MDFARNGRNIASGSGDRTVRVWDIEANREILSFHIEDGVTTVAMSPDGGYVAAGSLDKSVRVWDTRNGSLCERLDGAEGHKDSVYSVAFAPSGRELVSGSLDKTIKMWELGDHRPMMSHSSRGGKCIRTFEGHKVRWTRKCLVYSLTYDPGFCAQCCPNTRRNVGSQWIQRSRCTILGPSYRGRAIDVAGP